MGAMQFLPRFSLRNQQPISEGRIYWHLRKGSGRAIAELHLIYGARCNLLHILTFNKSIFLYPKLCFAFLGFSYLLRKLVSCTLHFPIRNESMNLLFFINCYIDSSRSSRRIILYITSYIYVGLINYYSSLFQYSFYFFASW